MCVKNFIIVKILEQKTRVQIVGLISSISYSIERYKNEKKIHERRVSCKVEVTVDSRSKLDCPATINVEL